MIRAAIDSLREEHRQLDPEGIEVGVSRQALDETLVFIAKLEAKLDSVRGCRLYVRSCGEFHPFGTYGYDEAEGFAEDDCWIRASAVKSALGDEDE